MNKCTDSIRARRPDISLDATGDESSVAWNEETPQWAFEQAELGWELDKGIQALPHLYRESFVLRHIEGLDYDEMSAILGVHRDTLKMRVYKARTLLCQSLAHLGTPPNERIHKRRTIMISDDALVQRFLDHELSAEEESAFSPVGQRRGAP